MGKVASIFYNRSGRYYFSRAIPSDFRYRLTERKFEVSIRTKTESKAAKSAAALSGTLERYWENFLQEVSETRRLGPFSRDQYCDLLGQIGTFLSC